MRSVYHLIKSWVDLTSFYIPCRDQLMSHLRPFAEQDKEVTETDIRAFFEAKMAEKSEKKS